MRILECQGLFPVVENQIIALMLVSLLGCSDSGTGLSKTPLSAVTNLTAYSAGKTSVGLSWTASADTSSPDFQQQQISVELDSSVILRTFASRAATGAVIGNLSEGIVYTFKVTAIASSASATFGNSMPAAVRWASARRFAPDTVYEIAHNNGSSSGLEFFDLQTVSPRVLPVSYRSAYQDIIDLLLDSTSTGGLVLKSAHLNPLLVGYARHTRFSTVETSSDYLDVGSSSPPDPATYTRDSVVVDSSPATTGKIFYAVSSDSDYVRILVERDVSSLFFDTAPNRYVGLQLSFQFAKNVPFAKRTGR